ncbi:MAG: hypothetical protein ABI791_13620 [Acidobacteriota bacterium]
MIKPDRLFTIIAASFAVAYVLFRFWGLTDSCLWFDEIFGVHAAEMPVGDMLWFVAQDLIHPPLFYLLLKGWMGVGGESLFWLRSFSVFWSIAALAPFLFLCKELKLSYTARLIALAFLATNGALIKYAQEVRMYGPLLFLSLVSMWLFARFFYRGKNIWILTLVNVLLVYTHYFGWFVVASEVLAILLMQRIKIRHVLIMLGILIASYVPWIWALAQASGTGADVRQNIGWIEKPGLRALFDFAFDVVEPFYSQQTSIDPKTILIVAVPLLIAVAAAKLSYFANWKKPDDHTSFIVLSIFATLPLVLAMIASWIFPVSIWGTRHLIIVFPAMFLVIGIMFDAVEFKPLKMVLIALTLLMFCVGFGYRVNASRPEMIWCAWERQVKSIPADVPQTVYVFEDLVAYHMWFAVRDSLNVQIVKVNGIPEMQEDKAYFLPRGFDAVKTVGPDEMSGDRFWVAFRDMQWNEKHPPINILLAEGYRLGQPREINSGGLKSFLVEASK